MNYIKIVSILLFLTNPTAAFAETLTETNSSSFTEKEAIADYEDNSVQEKQVEKNCMNSVDLKDQTDVNNTIDTWMPDKNLQQVVANHIGIEISKLAIEDLKKLVSINAANKSITNLTGLEYAENLTNINLQNNQIIDLTPIENLKNISILNLHDNLIVNAEPLKNMVNLIRLDLSENNLKNTDFLANLANIQSINLNGNQITDLQSLEQLINLSYLDLTNNQIKDISSIANTISLTDLRLGNNQIVNIQPLEKLTNLTRLYLYQNKLQNIDALSNLKSLVFLHLGENQIKSIAALATLNNLTDLEIFHNEIDNLLDLHNLKKLTKLLAYDNNIQTLTGVNELINLRELSAYNNQIQDINALANLSNLNKLALQNNQIVDITSLKGLTNLTVLNLAANKISEIDALEGLNLLTHLCLPNNQITKVSPLKKLVHLQQLILNNQEISLNNQVIYGNSFVQKATVQSIDDSLISVDPWASNAKGIYDNGTISWNELMVPNTGELISYWHKNFAIGGITAEFSGTFKQPFETRIDQTKINVHDSTIDLNSSWKAEDNFDSALDEEGKKVSYENLTVTGNVNTTKAGSYSVTYTYKNVTKTITVTVTDSEPNSEPNWYVSVPATIHLSESQSTESIIKLVSADDQRSEYRGNKKVEVRVQSEQGFCVTDNANNSLGYEYRQLNGKQEVVTRDTEKHVLGTMNKYVTHLKADLKMIDKVSIPGEYHDVLTYSFNEID